MTPSQGDHLAGQLGEEYGLPVALDVSTDDGIKHLKGGRAPGRFAFRPMPMWDQWARSAR